MIGKPTVRINSFRSFCGQASFFAGLVPHLRPFLAGCWAAIADAGRRAQVRPIRNREAHRSTTTVNSEQSGVLRAGNGIVFTQQAAHSLSWLAAFFGRIDGSLVRRFPYEKVNRRRYGCFVATDASPWGIGGILVLDGTPVQYFSDIINIDDCTRFRAKIGDSAFNTLWEALAMLIAIRLWLPENPSLDLQVRGDNLSALASLLKLKAKDPLLNSVAREIALDIAEGMYEVNLLEHIPGIANQVPDALSRLNCPEPAEFPMVLTGARHSEAPVREHSFWRTWRRP